MTDAHLGWLNFLTLGIAGFILNAATLIFPIFTLILQMDSAKIAPINNDIMVDPTIIPEKKTDDPTKPVTPVTPADPSKG